MKKNKHTKALTVWTYVFAGLLVFLVTVSIVLTQVDFLYYTICSAAGGSKRVLKKGNPDDYVYYESSYKSKNEVLSAANALNERIVEEGIVLLKNEDNALPLKSERKITVFGKNSVNLIIGGSGSNCTGESLRKSLELQKLGVDGLLVISPYYNKSNEEGIYHHLADVMRAKLGEEVVLCGPDGLEYLGTVTAIEPGRVEFSVTDGTTSKAEPDCAVTLFAGYPKAGKLEEVIRHSVELGVTEVVPFFSRYCVASSKKEDVKCERYNRIAAEAAKQAGRAMLPHVAMPLPDFGAVCKAFADFDLVLFFYEGGGAPLREILHPSRYKRIAIVTGSEGGFSVEEATAAKAAGAVTVGLGPRILRCETAPLAALTATMLLTGNLE